MWQLAWTRHGIVAARASGEVNVIDVQEAQIRQKNHTVHDIGIVSLSCSANEALLLTNSMDGRIALWQWDEERALQVIAQTHSVRDQQIDGEPVRVEAWTTALHPDGAMFAAAGEGASVVLYSAAPETFAQALERLPCDALDANTYALTLQFVRHDNLRRIVKGTCSLWARTPAACIFGI